MIAQATAPIERHADEIPSHTERLLYWWGAWARGIPGTDLGFPHESIFYAIWKRGAGIVTNGPHIADAERDSLGMAIMDEIKRLPSFTMMQIVEQRYRYGADDTIGALRIFGPRAKVHSSEYQHYRRMRISALWCLSVPLQPLEKKRLRLCGVSA